MNTNENERGIDKDIGTAELTGRSPTDILEPKSHDRRTLYWTVREKFGYSHLAAVMAVATLENGGPWQKAGVFPGGVYTVAQLQKNKAAQKFLRALKDECETFAESVAGHRDQAPSDLRALLDSLSIAEDGGEADDIRHGRV